ncbi:diacylglycerol kinase [Paraburkholderia terricola]|uniref:Diacylglycerol kinase n=1 Tax=Paraburkholderia terricola TaxID=169427 RepID=A0ABU1LWX0_9BURK|nr:diacylglycerol kinase [Paraburkholderia terricola]MDR6411249.1 diacylglycerol kinase (ATP) [Paraburkholderia terricola]MDR6483511.1 diacylglycerol kinase (ATP) [Paraburkholderia terricola]
MRERNATVTHATNGAARTPRTSRTTRSLRATEADAASVEPFDDVREREMPHHAGDANHAHGMNGMNSSNDNHGDPRHEPLSPDDPLAPLPFNPYKGNRGLTRAWHAMKNSLAGFRVAIREESAFRQELTLAAILIPCGVLVPVEPVARVLLLGSVLLVLIVELLNSSVEAAIDRISLERHELSRRAKDLGSAAVMVALGMCLMTWLLIVGPLVVAWVKAWLAASP